MSNFKKYMSVIQEMDEPNKPNKNVITYTKEGSVFEISAKDNSKMGFVDQTYYISSVQGPKNPPVLTRVGFNTNDEKNKFEFKEVSGNEETSLTVFKFMYGLSEKDISNIEKLIKSSFEKPNEA